MWIFDNSRILGRSLHNISVFKLPGIDQTDHNPIHRIFHILFKRQIIIIRDLQIFHDSVVGAGIRFEHILYSQHHAGKRDRNDKQEKNQPCAQRQDRTFSIDLFRSERSDLILFYTFFYIHIPPQLYS